MRFIIIILLFSSFVFSYPCDWRYKWGYNKTHPIIEPHLFRGQYCDYISVPWEPLPENITIAMNVNVTGNGIRNGAFIWSSSSFHPRATSLKLIFDTEDGERIRFYVNSNSCDIAFDLNEKIFVAVTYDRHTVKMYKDGTKIKECNIEPTGAGIHNRHRYGNAEFLLSSKIRKLYNTQQHTECFVGIIYNATWYSRILSDSEIGDLYVSLSKENDQKDNITETNKYNIGVIVRLISGLFSFFKTF